MYKHYEHTIQPGVTAANPTEFETKFMPCVLERVVISFKNGPNWEVYVRIKHGPKFLIPEDPEEWINGENEPVVFTGPWALWDEAFVLTIQMCAPTARLSHKIGFRFDLGELALYRRSISAGGQLIIQSISL